MVKNRINIYIKSINFFAFVFGKSSTAARLRGVIFAAISSGAVFFLNWNIPGLFPWPNDLLISLGIGFISYIYPVSKQAIKNQTEAIEILSDSIRNAIIYRGSLHDLLNRQDPVIISAISKSKSIRNTLAYYPSLKNQLNKRETSNPQFSPEALLNRAKYIEHALQIGCQWEEIYSRNILKTLNSEIKEIKIKHGIRYQPHVLLGDQPIINMTLFKNHNDKESFSEAWFGFGLVGGMEDGPVFSTREPRLIEYFDNYFSSLINIARPWQVYSPEQISGAWISVSYDSRSKSLLDVAIVEIVKIDKSDKFSLSGKIYVMASRENKKEEYTFELKREFKTIIAEFIEKEKISSVQSRPMMFFCHVDSFRTSGKEDSRPYGGGYYSFLSENNLSEYEGLVYSSKGSRRGIFGKKLSTQNDLIISQDDGTGSGHIIVLERLFQNDLIIPQKKGNGTSQFKFSSDHFSYPRDCSGN